MKNPNLDSYWNYRVLRRVHKLPDGKLYEQFGIYEVYYSDGQPDMCSVKPERVICESVEELKETLQRMKTAFDKSILEYTDFDDNKKGA